MRRVFPLLLVFVLAAAIAQAAPLVNDHRERVFNTVVHLRDLSDLRTLKPLYLTIEGRNGLALRVLAAPAEIDYLRQAGWKVDVLGRADQVRSNKAYHTYASALSEMQGLVSTYPTLASLESVATSVEGRYVWAMKISDNVSDDEAEPALLFDYTLHGDEQVGMEVGLGWIHDLLDNYGTDDEITGLVDDLQIYVVPMMNPDGVVGVSRYNGNGEDLNRSYPFWWEGWGTWSPEPETGGMVDFGLAHNFVLNASGHGGAEVVNYVWDSIYTISPEDDLEQLISNEYADETGYDVTNGAAWYIADGSSEDWFHGALGSLAAIVELSYDKMPDNFAYYVDLNLPALRVWSAFARQGIWGTVTDDVSGDPLEAVIIVDERMPVYTNPLHGDFYRILEAGTYDLRVWANGYGWNEVTDVVVPADGHLSLPIALTAAKSNPALVRCVLNFRKDASDDPNNVSLPKAALGGPDGEAFSLGVAGWAVFDLGANSPVTCDGSLELYVTEKATDGADGYTVSVAEDDWRGPWLTLGTGTGSASFDLDGVGCTSVRYVKIVDDGNGSNLIATPGADIDAVEAVIASTDDDTTDDDTIDDDATDDDAIDDDTTDDDVTDDDLTDDDLTDDDVTDDDADDDVTDDDADDDADDDVTDDDTAGDDDAADDDDDDDDSGCGC